MRSDLVVSCRSGIDSTYERIRAISPKAFAPFWARDIAMPRHKEYDVFCSSGCVKSHVSDQVWKWSPLLSVRLQRSRTTHHTQHMTIMTQVVSSAPFTRHCCCIRMKHKTLPFSILLVGILLQACSSLPLFMVFSGRGKCVSVEAAAQTALKVQYEAPGMKARCAVYKHVVFYILTVALSL